MTGRLEFMDLGTGASGWDVYNTAVTSGDEISSSFISCLFCLGLHYRAFLSLFFLSLYALLLPKGKLLVLWS